MKNKTDLFLDAYENDLNKEEFKTPLIFFDKKTRKFNLEILSNISEEENKNTKINKEVDIVYLIDGNESMGNEINSAKEYVIQIFKELNTKYENYNFHFGVVFYRDKIDSKDDKNDYFPLTDNIEYLKKANVYY